MESATLAESALASVVVVLLQAVTKAATVMMASNFFIFNYNLTGKVADIQEYTESKSDYFFLKKIRIGTPLSGKLSLNLFSR